MGVIVQPNYMAFTTRYAEFASPGGTQPVSADLYALYFNEATLYQANNGAGPICDSNVALTLMQQLIAHIASLNTPSASGDVAPNVVGRISSAGEGSVNISTENQYPAGTPQWYQQTKYGAAWWAATARFRTMRYMTGPAVVPAGQGLFGWSRSWGRGCR